MEEDRSSEVINLSGRLFLKFNNTREGDGVLSLESDPLDQPILLTHQCVRSGKEFGSRKGLDGHTWIHNIHENTVVKKGRAAELVADESNREKEDRRTACDICRKDFLSVKSLYGHKKSHPEREWRGMRPPHSMTAKPSVSYSSIVSDTLEINDHQSAELHRISRWPGFRFLGSCQLMEDDRPLDIVNISGRHFLEFSNAPDGDGVLVLMTNHCVHCGKEFGREKPLAAT